MARENDTRPARGAAGAQARELVVTCCPDAVEAVCYALTRAGCRDLVLRGRTRITVLGCVPDSPQGVSAAGNVAAHLARLPEFGLPPLLAPVRMTPARPSDWSVEWKKHFKPLHVGARIVIKPSWEHYRVSDGEIVIEIDPGMAFGTGDHPTTRLCLEALESYVRPGMTVADIGTGSGILAIAASRLGATRVYATDTDAQACRIARENVARNGLAGEVTVLSSDGFSRLARGCDLIVANIVAATIIEVAPSVATRLKNNGTFIACGIVDERAAPVRRALEATGLRITEVTTDGSWVRITAELSL